jgi:hypothetical protein
MLLRGSPRADLSQRRGVLLVAATLTFAVAATATPSVAQPLMVGADGAVHLDEFSGADLAAPVVIEQPPTILPPNALGVAVGCPMPCPHCGYILHQPMAGSSLMTPMAAAAGGQSQGLCVTDFGYLGGAGLHYRPDFRLGPGCTGGVDELPLVRTVESFSLASALGLDPALFTIGGWSQLGYHDNNNPLSQAYNDLLSFNDVPDNFHLQQQWLYIARAANGSRGFDVGGRIDVVYGADAQKMQAFGNPNAGVRNFGSFDASLDHGEYGWAIPQAYGEAAAGPLSVKVGRFFSPVGYEVIPAVGNFFNTHSYTMFNSEPFTHTGVLARLAPVEQVALYAGWSLGWDTGFDQLNQGNNAIAGLMLRLLPRIALAYMGTFGNFGWRDGGDDNSYQHSVVLTADITERLQYVLQSDLIDTSNPGVSEFDTIGVNNYVLFKLSDLFALGGRFEWWKADGVSFYEATGGVNIQPLHNLIFRPEYRHDWAPGIRLDEPTFAIDMILAY